MPLYPKVTKFLQNNRILMRAIKEQNMFDGLCILCGHQLTSFRGLVQEFQDWYMAAQFQEIAIFITRRTIYFLAEQTVYDQLEFLSQVKRINILLLVKPKRTHDYSQQFRLIIDQIRKQVPNQIIRIGMILAEPQSGACQNSLNRIVEEQGILIVDATLFVRLVFTKESKDKEEFYKKCARINSTYMKRIFDWVEASVQQNENITHYHIQKRVERLKSDKMEQTVLERRCQLTKEYQILSAVVQSGGQYDQDATESNMGRLCSDSVIVTIACQYQGCQTYCQRTMLFSPDANLQRIYRQLIGVQAYAITMARDQIRFDEVYSSTKQVWQSVVGYEYQFPSDIGFVLGEDSYITEKNKRVVENGMYLVIRLFVDGIQATFPLYAEQVSVALGVADTIIVGAIEEEQQITKFEKEIAEIMYEVTPDGKQIERMAFLKREKHEKIDSQLKIAQEMYENLEENRLIKNQELLKQKKQYELEQRLAMQQLMPMADLQIKMGDLNCVDKFPDDLPLNEIHIDHENFSIYMPLRGTHVVFHIHTIKNVFVSPAFLPVEDLQGLAKKFFKFRVCFWTNEFKINTRQYPALQPKTLFVKELTFLSTNESRLYQYKAQIEELKQTALNLWQERQQDPTVAEAHCLGKVIEIPKEFPILYDLRIRPTVSPHARSVEGHLECHQNGFRYISCRQEVIDFTFANVRHAFYQSPEEEVISALHFVFKQEIKAQRKVYTQLQFYREIKGAGEQEAARKQTKFCQLDVQFDQQVQRERNQNHKAFSQFMASCEPFIKEAFHFEKPQRRGAFEGNWAKERLLFQPTPSCLVNLVDQPFFVLTLKDVDIMCCERVQEGTLSFDLIAVLKDLEQPVIRIDAVDFNDLKKVKFWMNNVNILFFVSSTALMWRNMQFSIQKDYPLFVYEGGWSKIMKDVMDHAPLQLQNEDDMIFEPDSSNGPTSISEFEFDDGKNNPYLHIEMDQDESLSDVLNSNFLSEEEGLGRSRKKKKLIQID